METNEETSFNSHNDIRLLYKVLIKIQNKHYSLDIPNIWTFGKLRKFIENHLLDSKTKTHINIIYTGKVRSDEDIIGEVFKSNLTAEIHQLFITFKKINENDKKGVKSLASNFDQNTPKTEISNSSEFKSLENWIFNSYRDSLSVELNTNLNYNRDFLHLFPLFNTNISQRIETLNNNDFQNLKKLQEPVIENFPIRGYFKIALFLRLLLLFFMFASNMKGLSFPIFLSFLFVYYWYNVKEDIEQYYQKKKEELNIKESDLQKYGFSNESDEEEETKENLKRIINEKENIKEEVKESNEESKVDKENVLNKPDEARKNSLNQDDKIEEEPKNTSRKSSLHKDQEKIKLTKKERENLILDEIIKNENKVVRLSKLFVEFIFTFVFSLYPNWSDAFEQDNPIIINNNPSNPNPAQVQQVPLIVNENNLNEPANQDKGDKLNDEEILIETIPIEKKSLENSVNNRETSDLLINEKLFKTSINETKKVNIDDTENRTKYVLVDESENKLEKEYVFSEHVNIDSLSYNNESVSELLKKKESEKTFNNQNALNKHIEK